MRNKPWIVVLGAALCWTVLQASDLKKQRALEMVEKAMIEYAQGNFQAMHRAAAKALDYDPACSKAFVYMGIYNLRHGELEEARGWLDKALLADPGNALAYTFLGDLHYRNDDLATAADYWRRAVSFDECLSEAQAGLALSLYKTGQESDAIQHYKEAIRCDKRYYDIEYLSDAKKGAGWPEAKVAAVRPLLERVPPPALR